MKRVLSVTVAFVSIVLFVSIANAKIPTKTMNIVISAFPAAMPQKGLESAFEQIDPSKMRGYVVMEKGGVAAEQARHFISWQRI